MGQHLSPISGTASEVGGIVSATSRRNTVSDSRMVTPENNIINIYVNIKPYTAPSYGIVCTWMQNTHLVYHTCGTVQSVYNRHRCTDTISVWVKSFDQISQIYGVVNIYQCLCVLGWYSWGTYVLLPPVSPLLPYCRLMVNPVCPNSRLHISIRKIRWSLSCLVPKIKFH